MWFLGFGMVILGTELFYIIVHLEAAGALGVIPLNIDSRFFFPLSPP